MTVTYTIDNWNVEGNRRINYGHFDMASGDCSGSPPAVVRSMNTGLRMVDMLKVYNIGRVETLSGQAAPVVTYPAANSYPARNSTSGHFTIEFTSTATLYWEARGKV